MTRSNPRTYGQLRIIRHLTFFFSISIQNVLHPQNRHIPQFKATQNESGHTYLKLSIICSDVCQLMPTGLNNRKETCPPEIVGMKNRNILLGT